MKYQLVSHAFQRNAGDFFVPLETALTESYLQKILDMELHASQVHLHNSFHLQLTLNNKYLNRWSCVTPIVRIFKSSESLLIWVWAECRKLSRTQKASQESSSWDNWQNLKDLFIYTRIYLNLHVLKQIEMELKLFSTLIHLTHMN